MNKIARAMEMIERAISIVSEKIENAYISESGPVSKKQLSDFLSVLILMKRKLAGDNRVDESKIYDMGHIIIDSWPSPNSLGETIIKAEQAYSKAVNIRKVGSRQ